jgi:enterochelin esterase-like enzyme
MVRTRLEQSGMKTFQRFILLLILGFGAAGCQTTSAGQATVTPQPSQTPQPTLTITPAATETPKLVCRETRGYFDFYEIQTSLMTHPLSFRVYLPPCYDFENNTRYPVLYFLHGQSFNDDQWDRLGADEALDELIAAGKVTPFIIVMPKESNYMIDQWTSKYGPALAEELVPWIDAHFRTIPDRDHRAIGGLSRGAAWAMRTGLIYWETFGAIGGHSLAPFRGDFNEAPFWFKEIPEDQKPRIWIDAGSMDFMKDAARVFADRLEDYDMPFEWHVFDGAHVESFWAANVKTYLKWYAQGWE